jgi:hypothetical protein
MQAIVVSSVRITPGWRLGWGATTHTDHAGVYRNHPSMGKQFLSLDVGVGVVPRGSC